MAADRPAQAHAAPTKARTRLQGHIAGTRKEKVHKAFDDKGEDAARKLGLKLELKPGTLVSWFRTWRRGSEAEKKGRGRRKAS